MTSSVPSTPNGKISFRGTPKKVCKRSIAPPETPECYTQVSVETPVARKRISKEKVAELSNLTVAVRIRPMNSRELCCPTVYNAVTVQNNEITVKSLASGHGVGVNHTFQYDHVFCSAHPDKCEYASQEDVYLAIGNPLIQNAFKGYNACLLVYGQTGSGKSYSMMGEDADTRQNVGVIPRFCYDLFKRISELPDSCSAIVKISYFEIYNEKIHDLLTLPAATQDVRVHLRVREHPMMGPYVENLSQHVAKSYKELNDWLEIGNRHRATAATVLNEKSSRSHSIFSVELSLGSDGDNGRQSKISLVDLAGSERLGSSNVSDERHRQSVCINRSLLTLGKVISALADQKKSSFVPYRDSILTWLLRESLGGNSLTSMLATITPASTYIEDTLATLRYACQARSIVNRAHINEDPHNRLIRELRAEIENLRSLRQNYEQYHASMQSNLNNTSLLELEDLRQRLSETEHHLESAEKRKQELESHVRVMCTLDHDLVLSPYKSNFLQELEDMLVIGENAEPAANVAAHVLVSNAEQCCRSRGLPVQLSHCPLTGRVTARDTLKNCSAVCDVAHLRSTFKFEDPCSFLDGLDWTATRILKRNAKDSIHTHLKQMRDSADQMRALVSDDEQLAPAFAQLNRALQAFEKAATRTRSRSPCKSVTFNL